MVTILPVQNKNFSGNPEQPTEVPGADQETKSHLHGKTRASPKYRNGCKNSEKIFWMTEFLNTETHASSSHESSLEPTPARSADLGKHSVETHFPKDRNCEICQRTKITRAPCRRRNGGAVPRAANFGDLITADYKVVSDKCESRNNHRYAIVVQDLATQWIQSYPCKTKTSQETQRSLQKFLDPDRKPKVIYTDNSLEFGKACEKLSWNHCSSLNAYLWCVTCSLPGFSFSSALPPGPTTGRDQFGPI